jgi:hypothetical protein
MKSRILAIAALTLAMATTASPVAAKPQLDPSYADGKTVYMIGPHMITNPTPALYAHAEDLYLTAYWINPDGRTDLGQLTLPSGYQPQCDPCFHPGLPLVFVYHDHVLSGAPGMGTDTAAGFAAPWKVILLVYNPEISNSPSFRPVTSETQLDWAEANGWFLPINAGGDNPFELDTGQVLICPLASSNA